MKKKEPKFLNTARTPLDKNKKIAIILFSISGALLILIAVLLFLFVFKQEDEPTEPSVVTSAVTTQAPTTAEPTTEATDPPVTNPVMLPHMAKLYEQNPDIVGWVKIEGTKIDYPVMYTPEDEEKYIHRDFDGNFSTGGVPFMNKDCTVDPESTNLIIYGHNLSVGTHFADLMKYEDEEFWKEHPIITYTTLYEERTYEVLAAFRDRVYLKTDDVFKFYQFIDPETKAEYDEAIVYFKNACPYDTGVDAEFEDKLLTLVTCAYHHEKGRYVVVAREVTDKAG